MWPLEMRGLHVWVGLVQGPKTASLTASSPRVVVAQGYRAQKLPWPKALAPGGFRGTRGSWGELLAMIANGQNTDQNLALGRGYTA